MDMKKYRLVKRNDGYFNVDLGGVYDGDFVPEGWVFPVSRYVKWYPDEWEEVHDFQVDEIDGEKHYMVELKEGESLTVTINNYHIGIIP